MTLKVNQMGSTMVTSKNNAIIQKAKSNIPKELIMHSLSKRRVYPDMGLPLVE